MFETCLHADQNFYKASEALQKFEKAVDRSNWFEWWFGDFKVPKLADKQGKKHNPDKSRNEDIDKSYRLRKGKGKGVLGLILLAVVLAFTVVLIVDSSESLLGAPRDPKVVAGLAGTFVGLVAIFVGLLLIPTLGRLKAGATGIELDTERLSIEPTVESTELIRTTVPFEPSIYPVEFFAAPLRRVRTIILQSLFSCQKDIH